MRNSRAILAVLLIGACEPTSNEPAPATDAAKPAALEHSPQPVVLERAGGLTIDVISAGTGAEVAADSEVSLSYRAFVDGADEPFDASDDSGVPLRLQLGPTARPRVIPGLERGLVGLRVGTRAKLHIPAELGWGATGNPQAGVPVDAALVYEVHVLDAR